MERRKGIVMTYGKPCRYNVHKDFCLANFICIYHTEKAVIKINFAFSTVTEYDLYSKILRNSLFSLVNTKYSILSILNTILHITRIKVVHKNESQGFYKEETIKATFCDLLNNLCD